MYSLRSPENAHAVHVFVQSVRALALARNAMVGEKIYKQSKKNIFPQDCPTLFTQLAGSPDHLFFKLICEHLPVVSMVWDVCSNL